MADRSNRDLAARFGRMATSPTQPQPPSIQEEPQPRTSKFTVLFSRADTEDFDELLVGIRRRLGRRVDKSEVVRCLLRLTLADPSLESQLVEHLRDGVP